MDIDEWKRLARQRITSGEMTEDEWIDVLDGLLIVSESEGMPSFDKAVFALGGYELDY